MNATQNNLPHVAPETPAGPDAARRAAYALVASVIGCKWSLHVLSLIGRGVHRPGAMSRATPGLATKVLNECLTKMVRLGIVEREAFAQIPPRVEYRLTDIGRRFLAVVAAADDLACDLAARTPET